MTGLKCSKCNEPIKVSEMYVDGVHHVCPSLYCPCKCSREAHKDRSCQHKCVPYERQQRAKSGFCPCFNWAGGDVGSFLEHHPNCDGYGGMWFNHPVKTTTFNSTDAKPNFIDTSVYVPTCKELGYCNHEGCDQPLITRKVLQLLVIDLGDSCVIQVVKGTVRGITALTDMGLLDAGDVRVTGKNRRFATVRKAIEGDKPVPRIEEEPGGAWRLHFNNQQIEPQQTYIGPNARAALETLFGKPLPIYTGGTWEQLIKSGQPPYGPQSGTVPLSVWRYTREC